MDHHLDFLNPHEQKSEPIDEPTTLDECIEFAREYSDFEPLDSKVYDLQKHLKEAIEELKFMRDTAKAGGRLDFYVKKSNKILLTLYKLQK